MGTSATKLREHGNVTRGDGSMTRLPRKTNSQARHAHPLGREARAHNTEIHAQHNIRNTVPLRSPTHLSPHSHPAAREPREARGQLLVSSAFQFKEGSRAWATECLRT